MNDKGLAYCESAVPWQLGFQDPATPIMEGIVTLHHEVMAIIVFIGVFVVYLMVRCIQLFKKDVHPQLIELFMEQHLRSFGLLHQL